MARKEEVPIREKEICFRLREFREATKISRTTFALSVGIATDRMVSYELGRVPVRYEIFKAVNAKYFIRLDWLVNRRGSPTAYRPYDDSKFASKINGREKLTTIYDEFLSQHPDPDKEDAEAFFFGPDGLVERLEALRMLINKPVERRKLRKGFLLNVVFELEQTASQIHKALDRDLTPEQRYRAAMEDAGRVVAKRKE